MKSRVAKNALALYIRLFITMLVYLYMSRVLLCYFGVIDYGVYDVVSGVIYILSFLSLTFAASSQRFLAFYFGKQDDCEINEMFNAIFVTCFFTAFIILIISETMGVWIVNNMLNIPPNRLYAANWVLQCMLLSFLLNHLASPFNSMLVADEKMDISALIGILDVLLKFVSALVLSFVQFDYLILYSILIACSSMIVVWLNWHFWCNSYRRRFRVKIRFESSRIKSFLKYAIWYLFGTFAESLREFGVNILLNIFFNPAVNAGKAIAFQVNNAVTKISNSLFVAVRPHLVKTYAQGNINLMNHFIEISSRISLFIMAIMALPIIVNVKGILNFWLYVPPGWAPAFIQLMLVNAIAESINNPLASGIQATGKIKTYHLTVSVIYLLNLPLSFICLHFYNRPEMTLYVSFFLILMALPARLYLCRYYHQMNLHLYVKYVLLRGGVILFICYAVCKTIRYFVGDGNILLLFISIVLAMLINIGIVFYTGFSKEERNYIYSLIIDMLPPKILLWKR